MYIHLEFNGYDDIMNNMESTLEIKLPPEPNEPYKYINDIEYYMIKHINYTVYLDDNILLNSDSNQYGKICGISLLMYDDIENRRQIFYYPEDNIIRFCPCGLYKGCLDSIFNNNNLHDVNELLHYKLLDRIKLEINIELDNFNVDNILIIEDGCLLYENIDDNNTNNANLLKELNSIPITWELINNDFEGENPTKKSKNIML